MPKHILVVLSADPPGKSEELQAWSKEHVEHMVELPWVKSAQAFRFHPEHDFAFPETVPTRPDYQNLILYELKEGAEDGFLHPDPNRTPSAPPDPPGGIGPHRPDGYLFVAATDEITAK